MGNTLLSRVLAIRQRAEWLVLLHGLGKFLAASLGLIFVLALIDFWLRPASGLARGLFSGGLLVGMILLARKWVGPAFAYRASEIVVARRIEARFPALRHQLASSVEFLTQSVSSDLAEQSAGSTALRTAVIEETEQKAESLDFRQSLDDRPTRTMLFWAGMAVLVLFLFGTRHPQELGLSAQRLALPWGTARWPLRHQLTFNERPQQIAIGSTLELALRDQMGKLPDRAWLQIRKGSSFAARVETKEMVSLGEQMVVRLENVNQPLDYRAFGGDDDTMPWTHLVPLEVPRLVSLESEIEPPAYTELPPYAASRVLSVLAGSQWKITGKADRPLKHAALRRKASPSRPNSSEGESPLLSVRLAGETAFTFPQWLLVSEDFPRQTELELLLTAQDGLESSVATLQLTLLADAPPKIIWDAPANGGIYTREALIALSGQVRDDFGLASVELRYSVISEGESAGIEYSLPLYRRSQVLAPTANTGVPFAQGVGGGEDRWQLASTWDLSQLKKIQELSTGTSLSLRLAAVDTKGQQTLTDPRRINLVSQADFEASLLRRQEAIQRQLVQVLQIAESAQTQTRTLSGRWEPAREISPADLNSGQAIELLERGVLRGLTQPTVGVLPQLASLQADTLANRLPPGPLAARLTEMQQQLARLQKEQLTPTEEGWGKLLRSLREQLRLQTSATPTGDTAATEGDMPMPQVASHATTGKFQPELQTILKYQTQSLAVLRSLLGQLSLWDSFRQVSQQLEHIARSQTRLNDETKQRELARALGEPKAKTSVAELANEQIELGREYDKWLAQLEAMAPEGGQPSIASNPADETESLKLALSLAKKYALGGKMRLAGSQIKAGEGEQSRQSQQELGQHLRTLQRALAGEQPASSRGDGNSTTQDRSSEAAAELARFLTAAGAEQQRLCQATQEILPTQGKQSFPFIDSVAADQQALSTELQGALAGKLSWTKEALPGTFHFAIRGAQRQMVLAVASLKGTVAAAEKEPERKLAWTAAQQHQQSARQRIQGIVSALKEAAGPSDAEGNPLAPAATNQAAADPSNVAGPRQGLGAAELHLLKSLQQEILKRSEAIQKESQDAGKLTLLDQQKLEELAREQQELATILWPVIAKDRKEGTP